MGTRKPSSRRAREREALEEIAGYVIPSWPLIVGMRLQAMTTTEVALHLRQIARDALAKADVGAVVAPPRRKR